MADTGSTLNGINVAEHLAQVRNAAARAQEFTEKRGITIQKWKNHVKMSNMFSSTFGGKSMCSPCPSQMQYPGLARRM